MIFLIIVVVLSLDQFTKFIIVKNLLLNQSIPVIKGIFHISLVHNRGAAFGVLKNQVPVLILTAVLAIALIYVTIKKNKDKGKYLEKIALSLVLAGALGNLIDRICFGYVIDFLDFRIWPVFNVADSAITIGAIILGWTILRERKAHSA